MSTKDYRTAYERSLDDPEGFWAAAAQDISWIKRWDRVMDESNPPFVRWFPGGMLNSCYNAVDRHVERGRGSGLVPPIEQETGGCGEEQGGERRPEPDDAPTR